MEPIKLINIDQIEMNSVAQVAALPADPPPYPLTPSMRMGAGEGGLKRGVRGGGGVIQRTVSLLKSDTRTRPIELYTHTHTQDTHPTHRGVSSINDIQLNLNAVNHV